MGSSGKITKPEFDEIILHPATESICATEPRFCLPNSVTLRLSEKFWSFSANDFKITDATTNTIFFQSYGKVFSLTDKKTLCDCTGCPVVTIEHQLGASTCCELLPDKYKVYLGDDSSNHEICKFSTQPMSWKTKLTATFKDVITGKQHYIVLKGNWFDKKSIIYLGEPKQNGIPIAKIYRPFFTKNLIFGGDEYDLEISPGVDIAFCVSMCIVMDITNEKH